MGSPETRRLPQEGRGIEFWLFLLALAIYGAGCCFRLGSADLGSDEGRFGLSGANILADHRQLAVVSQDPLGPPGTMPYFYPLCLAGSISLLGRTEFALRFVNVLVLAIGGCFVWALAMFLSKSRLVAMLASCLFLLNPGTIAYARTALPEASVVAWGSGALFAAARFYESEKVGWAGICGLCLGLAFLSKLWLVFPFLLACLLLLAGGFLAGRKRGTVAGLALALVVFGAVSSSQLWLSLWLAPGAYSHWIQVCYVFTLKSRVGGAGYDPQMWYRPWWFYPAAFFKASFFGFPLLVLGFHALVRRRRWLILGVVGALLCPIAVFSLFRVKQATYIFPAFPGLALAVAYGIEDLFRHPARKTLIFGVLLSAAVSVFFYAKGVFGLRDLGAMLLLYSLYLVAAIARGPHQRRARVLVAAASALAMLFAGVVVIRRSLEHRTYYREIAAYFRPQLRGKEPQQVVFTSPEYPALEFYTFRTGEYWETYYFHQSNSDFINGLKRGASLFYVVDPTGVLYGGTPTEREWEALRRYATEVTTEIERSIGHSLPLRVFVPTVASVGPGDGSR